MSERTNEWECEYACFINPDDSVRNNTQQVVVHKYAVPYVSAQGIWILFWYFCLVFPLFLLLLFLFVPLNSKHFLIDIWLDFASTSITCYLKWLLVMTKYWWSLNVQCRYTHSIQTDPTPSDPIRFDSIQFELFIQYPFDKNVNWECDTRKEKEELKRCAHPTHTNWISITRRRVNLIWTCIVASEM